MNNMLSEALRVFFTGPLKQLIVNLGGHDGDQWEEELKKFLRKEPCWSDNRQGVPQTKSCTGLLELQGTVTIPATTGQFVAKDWFVPNTDKDALVRISGLGDNFRKWFLTDTKIEDPIQETVLCRHKLLRSSTDKPIIAELGGEGKSEITLTGLFHLMKNQGNGKSGVLLNNGWANIFYVRDVSGLLRSVDVRWDGDGWSVLANPVERPSSWLDGFQVFSRSSVLESLEPVPATS